MAEMMVFPQDKLQGAARIIAVIGCGLLVFALGAATIYLLLSSVILPFAFDGLAAVSLFMLPMAAFTGWMSGSFALLSVRFFTHIRIGTDGVALLRLWRKEKLHPWSDFQQVCICYGSGTPGKNDGNTVLCFAMHGEKKNIYDRWKVDNPWHDRRLIVADYSEELHAAVTACCPMQVADLRGSIAYPHPKE